MEFMVVAIAGLVFFMVVFLSGFFTVATADAAIVQRFGRFARVFSRTVGQSTNVISASGKRVANVKP